MDEEKRPILRRIYPRLYDSETGGAVPFTGKCLDCKAPTEEEGNYHCRACTDKYIEKNKPTPKELERANENLQKGVDQALLWMYDQGNGRYDHPCMAAPGEFTIAFGTIGEMERRGLVRGTGYFNQIGLTEEGQAQAKALYQSGKS